MDSIKMAIDLYNEITEEDETIICKFTKQKQEKRVMW